MYHLENLQWFIKWKCTFRDGFMHLCLRCVFTLWHIDMVAEKCVFLSLPLMRFLLLFCFRSHRGNNIGDGARGGGVNNASQPTYEWSYVDKSGLRIEEKVCAWDKVVKETDIEYHTFFQWKYAAGHCVLIGSASEWLTSLAKFDEIEQFERPIHKSVINFRPHISIVFNKC